MALAFDANYYLSTRPDVFNAFVKTAGATGQTWAQFAQAHYNTFGRFEGSNPNATFNTNEYLAANPDVAAAGVNPFTHFLNFGAKEGRAPSATFPSFASFDEKAYLAANPDLGAAGITTKGAAYEHFVKFGQFEARPGAPAVDTGVPGQTFTLTIGEDKLTGTGNNDVFTAAAVQGNGGVVAATLESIDVLDGGAGTDTLNVTASAGSAPILKNIENINARFTAIAELELDNASGVSTVTVANSAAVGQVSGLGSVANLVVKDQTQNVEFDDSKATTLNLSLMNFGTAAAANTVDLGKATAAAATTLNATLSSANAVLDSTQADAVTTLVVDATGTNGLSLVDSGDDVKSATVKGAGTVDFAATAFTGALATFDASANTGGVKADIQSTVKADVKGGAGADTIDMDTAVVADTTVALGAGDDKLYAGALVGSFKSADGGEGTDVINITDGATLTTANAAKISNFETLDVSGGTGTYDMSLEPFTKVQIDESINGALAGAVILSNAAANFTLDVASKSKTNANFALGQAQTVVLKDATGTSDTVNINVVINDGNNDAAADGNVTFTTSTTIAGVENINISSKVATLDTGVKANAYSTTFTDLIAADVKTLTLTGDSDIVFTALTNANNTLTKVDASAATGDITLDASAITSSVSYTGSAGVDTYSATDGGNIFAGAGNDQITLAAAGKADTIILKSAADTTLVDADSNGKIDAFTAEAYATFTSTASAGGNSADIIDVTSFGFTGFAGSALNKGAIATAIEGGAFDASIADFFADAGGDRGVAFGTNGGNTYVFVDANKDGNFTAANDIIIEITGVTDLGNADFAF